MPRKPQKKRPAKDPEQYARFLEAAREAGASDNPKDLEKAIKRLAPATGSKSQR
jgi:hypothetical protein